VTITTETHKAEQTQTITNEANATNQDSAHNENKATSTGSTESSPKEWQKYHDSWLNSIKQTVIGEEYPPLIPWSLCAFPSSKTGLRQQSRYCPA